MPTRTFGPYTVDVAREDKVLFPDAGVTKGDLIGYYERVADLLLPHLEKRPLVLQRFPDGIGDDGFYQKQVPAWAPDWLDTVTVDVRSDDEDQDLIVCSNRATLVWLANQAAIALHPWLSRTGDVEKPDQLVVDLDPPGDSQEDFDAVRAAALWVRELLEGDLDLACFAKLTGSKGLHVVTPLDADADFDTVRSFARRAMDLLAERHPQELTTEQRKNERRGRLYLDVARNAYAQTAVAPWSVRPRPEAPVAVPVAWTEVEEGSIGPRDVTVVNVAERIGEKGDPWKGWRRRARSLDGAREKLSARS